MQYKNLGLPFSLADSFAGTVLRNNFSTRFENSVRNNGGHLSPAGDKHPEGAAAEVLKYWPTAKMLYRGLYHAYLKGEEKEACVTRKYLAGSHQ